MKTNEIIRKLKKEFMGELIPPDEDDKLTRPCPILLEENIYRFERWNTNCISTPKFDPKKDSIVALSHCKSYSQGDGCKHIKVCWKN